MLIKRTTAGCKGGCGGIFIVDEKVNSFSFVCPKCKEKETPYMKWWEDVKIRRGINNANL